MTITELPIIKAMGIEQREDGRLVLDPSTAVFNPWQSIHATAQFALAETQSGLFLQSIFPEYKGKIVPLLRSSSLKYKSQATKTIEAIASIEEEEKSKFLKRFEAKGRASITVSVQVIESDGTVTMTAEFTWFIQSI